MRDDLADIRLAEYVFAPHYAAPLAMVATRPAVLRSAASKDASVITQLQAGAAFEALDFAKGFAWGIARGAGRVGYVDQASLAMASDAADGGPAAP
ncbi:MAG: hypothetical protein B7Y45_06105 [Sphingomonas sp. 28-66-16]|nr:MAG: hypothetical protein B7Y45_06105 [Sphingomonas sp. 28-66-16]